MATIEGANKKLTVSGEQIEESVGKSHEHSNSAVLDKLSDNNGTLQYNGADITGGGSATEYTLPTASTTVLGGVKVDGSTITVNPDGIISATSTGTGLTEEQSNNVAKIPTIENNVNTNTSSITELKEYKQNKTDNTLDTTDKTIVGAINEVKLSIPTRTSELENNSNFITNDDLPTVPTKVSDLENDSGFITSIPEEYITETELETKGYLTEHQSLTDYAKKTDIPDVSNFLTEVPTEYVTDTKLSTELDKKVNKEVGKGLSTNDLTNELVTKINSSATEAFVTNAIANAQLGGEEVDLSGYATVDALKLKADLTHTHDQYLTEVPDEYITETELTGKNYADKTYVTQAVKNVKVDLTGYAKTSDIPTKVSDLTNDSKFITSIPEEYITETELNAKGYLTSHQDISGLQTKTDDKLATTSKEVVGAINELKKGVSSISVPTKVSQLTNDKGYLSSVPSEYVTEAKLNAKGYLTEHQDISNLALKSEIPDVSSFITSDDLPTVPTKVSELTNDKNYISSIPSEYVTETELKAKGYLTSVPSTYALKTDIPTVPTKVSDLANDSNFITSIPEEYITETELNAKGYLTSHQDISGLQTKTDKNLVTTSKEVVGAINEVKSLNDTKLNKTDANKLNCVVIDNVSLKEYILTTFTGTEEKTYYIIANPTCTDLPKASNFYITVETPGLYTYKVTAKELNDSNGSYVCTYRTTSSLWTKWEKVYTTTVADVGKTLITISDETNYKNSSGSESFYVVRNGICYVTLVIDCVSPSSNIEIATLPKAYGGIFRFSMGKENTAMDGYVLQDGSLKLSGGTADTKYYVGSFSYPVAES